MRLVIDGRRLTAERTGVGRYLELLLQDWAISGAPLPETVVVLHERAGLARVPKTSEIRAEVRGEGWPGLIWERLALVAQLRPGDLLFAPANLVPWGWRGSTLLALHDTLQEVLPESFPWHLRWRFGPRYRQSARRATRILVLSETTRRDVSKFYEIPDDRLRVVYPAPDPRFCPLDVNSAEVVEARSEVGLGSAPFFLFVGKASKRRNLPAILRGFERYLIEHPDHKLVFAGPGKNDGLAQTSPSIVSAGHVSEAVLRGLMANALGLLYPSEYEGFGLPVVEAMAAGCPVITLRRPPLVEAGGDAAFYLEDADPESLAQAMHVLSTDREVRRAFVSRGILQAGRFTSRRFADEVKAEIREIAASQPSGSPSRIRQSSLRPQRQASRGHH